MNLDFLQNPINTGIASFTFLAALFGVGFFLWKRNIAIGKGGIKLDMSQNISFRVPTIDRDFLDKCREITADNKDSLLALIPIENKDQHLWILNKFLEVVRGYLYQNHLTKIFSDEANLEKWKHKIVHEVVLKVRYMELYTDPVKIGFDLIQVEKAAAAMLDFCIRRFLPACMDCVAEKLRYYKSQEQTDVITSLVAKNERYFEGMNRIIK